MRGLCPDSAYGCAEGYLRVYRICDSGKRLELVHRTPVGGVPGALAPFKGRLLAGVGATLRIYEAGKKKLLRKCEHRKLPTHIATLATLGDRIYVGDLQARSLPWFTDALFGLDGKDPSCMDVAALAALGDRMRDSDTCRSACCLGVIGIGFTTCRGHCMVCLRSHVALIGFE